LTIVGAGSNEKPPPIYRCWFFFKKGTYSILKIRFGERGLSKHFLRRNSERVGD
jgi:hypothetical protein